jgi:hypothetical protein
MLSPSVKPHNNRALAKRGHGTLVAISGLPPILEWPGYRLRGLRLEDVRRWYELLSMPGVYGALASIWGTETRAPGAIGREEKYAT